jgi:hypothetical protein
MGGPLSAASAAGSPGSSKSEARAVDRPCCDGALAEDAAAGPGLALLIPLAARGMRLAFCRSIARMHGVEALKAAPPIARAFPVTQWMGSLRHLGRWLAEFIER